MLTRYWITINAEPDIMLDFGIGLGIGVTAYNLKDAESIIREAFDGSYELAYDDIIEDVSYDQLDKPHVAKNMGPMAVRGIWFPNIGAR